MGAQERRRLKRIRERVIIRDGMICCYCNCILTRENFSLDHIVPDSKKGTFNSTNLTASCIPCNNRRGDKPFFEYCKCFDFSEEKIEKYKKLYFNNLRIKILNIAKEECLVEPEATPKVLIKQACQILKIQVVDFTCYESTYELNIRLEETSERRKIKFCFEQLIRIIEGDY